MKRYWIPLTLTAVLPSIVVQGCTQAGGGTQTSNSAPAVPALPTKAQPKLATIKLWIGREEMISEMAITPIQEQTGMMFRTNMAENEGMIFVLSGPQRAGFWMMNTVLPLSAAYIDTDGKILELHDFKPHDTNTVYASHDNIQFVLETPQGWFERHKIEEGTVI